MRVAVVGFGRIGEGYARDHRTARFFPVATHAQAITATPGLQLAAVVDPDLAPRRAARTRWGVGDVAARADDLRDRAAIDILVLAGPPQARLAALDEFPSLAAVVAEKPLGSDMAQARALVRRCDQRGLALAVPFWRRFDPAMQRLADGGLERRIGTLRAAFAIYGGGVANNGVHLIDLARMLIGEWSSVRAIESSLPGNPAFALRCERAVLHAQPINFAVSREIAMDLWGDRGRVSILQEGLVVAQAPRRAHRAITGPHEIASDVCQHAGTGAGTALAGLYRNLVAHLRRGEPLRSPGDEALQAEAAVDAILRSQRRGAIEVARTLRGRS